MEKLYREIFVFDFCCKDLGSSSRFDSRWKVLMSITPKYVRTLLDQNLRTKLGRVTQWKRTECFQRQRRCVEWVKLYLTKFDRRLQIASLHTILVQLFISYNQGITKSNARYCFRPRCILWSWLSTPGSQQTYRIFHYSYNGSRFKRKIRGRNREFDCENSSNLSWLCGSKSCESVQCLLEERRPLKDFLQRMWSRFFHEILGCRV